MADTLRVVGDSLSSLSAQLGTAASLLDNSVSGLSGHEDAVGHGGVVDAVARFERHWGDGRTRIREQAENLSQVLADSVVSYDEAETDIAASLTPAEQVSVTGRQVAV